MAVVNLFAKLGNGLDVSCEAPVRKFFQQAVVINKTEIEEYTIQNPDSEPGVCAYNLTLTLKAGATGYRSSGPQAGSSFFGSFDKSRSDLGHTQYIHNASILIASASEEAKCILDSLDKGSFVVAYQYTDGTVEVYGMETGLTS